MTKLLFICLFFFCLAHAADPSLNDVLKKIENEKLAIQKIVNDFNAQLNSFKTQVADAVLADIKLHGLYLGNRWRIAEEGTGSYEALVFRDVTTTRAGTDRRYAFFKERYVDL